jgi:hypothetical protein
LQGDTGQDRGLAWGKVRQASLQKNHDFKVTLFPTGSQVSLPRARHRRILAIP